MTKKMLDIYTQFLEREHGSKIDIISVRPFGVTTPMMRMKKDEFMITPMDCAKSAVSDCLAGHKMTFSGGRHKMFHGFLQWNTEEQMLQIFEDKWR